MLMLHHLNYFATSTTHGPTGKTTVLTTFPVVAPHGHVNNQEVRGAYGVSVVYVWWLAMATLAPGDDNRHGLLWRHSSKRKHSESPLRQSMLIVSMFGDYHRQLSRTIYNGRVKIPYLSGAEAIPVNGTGLLMVLDDHHHGPIQFRSASVGGEKWDVNVAISSERCIAPSTRPLSSETR